MEAIPSQSTVCHATVCSFGHSICLEQLSIFAEPHGKCDQDSTSLEIHFVSTTGLYTSILGNRAASQLEEDHDKATIRGYSPGSTLVATNDTRISLEAELFGPSVSSCDIANSLSSTTFSRVVPIAIFQSNHNSIVLEKGECQAEASNLDSC
jgi:hypothetical protein